MREETITLAGGCFWCLEAVFTRVEGVQAVQSGYANGHTANPSYREVCSGTTGHAEVVQLRFDAERIALADVLRIYFGIHDPTTLNRQGADKGTQYRSGIYWQTPAQEGVAREVIAEVEAAGVRPVVTEVEPLRSFTPAEPEHARYYDRNPDAGYCAYVVRPKVAKLEQAFARYLK